jgi:hypothetical protein
LKPWLLLQRADPLQTLRALSMARAPTVVEMVDSPLKRLTTLEEGLACTAEAMEAMMAIKVIENCILVCCGVVELWNGSVKDEIDIWKRSCYL